MSMGEKLTIIAENAPKVFEAGKKERDAEWWNTYLTPMKNGSPNNYLFAGSAWNSNTFYPNQDIVITNNAASLFNRFSWNISPALDVAKRLEECGVSLVIDCSQASAVSDMFYYAWITRVPTLKLNGTKYTSLASMFQNSKIVTIDELIIRDDGANTFSSAFTGCTALKNVTFTGVIGRSISLSECPLSVASMKSIISALKDYSGTENEGTYSVTFSSACRTALDAEGKTSPHGNTWREYTSDLGWNC